MEADEHAPTPVASRLRRAHGKLTMIIAMIESGQDCQDIVAQLAAVSRDLGRAGFTIVADRMRQCAAAPGNPPMTGQQLENMLLTLA